MLSDKISASIQGSLVELNTGDVPNFERKSAVWLEKDFGGSLQLYPIQANYPAIAEDGSWILEPVGINWVTHNMNLSHPSWIKSSNVIVFPDEVPAPDASTYQADRIVWSSGDGATQILRKTVSLQPGRNHTLSIILMLTGGQLALDKDIIRLTGGVSGTPKISISQLNNFQNRYRLLSLNFKTSGHAPKLPSYSHQAEEGYAISSLTASTITINIGEAVSEGQLINSRIQWSEKAKFYSVIGNSSSAANGSVTLTLDATSLIVEGFVVGQTVRLQGAETVNVDLEFYIESTLALNFGGVQIEESPFRTSFIYQDSQLKIRAASRLVYRKNPIARLKTFGIFIELADWRGDGNLVDFGTLNLSIISGKLVVKASNVSIATESNLSTSSKIFLQISEENSSISLFVDKTLVAKSNLLGYVGDHHADAVFTSDGVRNWRIFALFDEVLLDGNPEVGQLALQEVSSLFDSQALIDAKAISLRAPLIALPPVTVPAQPAPIARSPIIGLNSASNTVIVADGTNFVIKTPVSIIREGRIVLRARIETRTPLTGTQFNLGLDLTAGVLVGDFLVYGNVDQPGKASVRFPFTPIDQQKILEVDPVNNRIRVSSTLSFNKGRGFIQTDLYQDIAEVLVKDKQDSTGYLVLENITNIQEGQIFSQPEDEMLVDPSCYLASLLEEIDRVGVAAKYMNGLVIENFNPFPVQVQPAIRVYY